MRGRFAVLAALFVLVPIVEIYFLIQVGEVIGPWWTILLLVAAGVLGSMLVKREGRRTWTALNDAVAAHRLPHEELADGALVLIGGTLLLTPGFLSDIAGLVLILPLTRPAVRALLIRSLARRVTVLPTPGAPSSGTRPPSGPGAPRTARRPGPDVVQGEVVEE